MPPFPYRQIQELRNLKNPRIPEMFFHLSAEEIIEAMVSQGYAREKAEREAAQFVAYRDALTTRQPVRDNEDDEEPQPPEPEHKSFFQSIADIKKGQ